MALRSSTTSRITLPLSPSLTPSTSCEVPFLKPPQLSSISISLPTSTTFSLFALLSLPHEAKALPKDQIVSSLTEVEKTIDQLLEVGSSFLETAQSVFGIVSNALKPGVDVALPILKQAAEQALKGASSAISEALKKAQEAIQSTGSI